MVIIVINTAALLWCVDISCAVFKFVKLCIITDYGLKKKMFKLTLLGLALCGSIFCVIIFLNHFGIIFGLTYTPKFNRNSMHFLLRKASNMNANMTSNEPAFRFLNPCWGHTGPPGDPRVPQGGPRHPPESQILQNWSPKPLKIIEQLPKNT